MAHVDKLPDGTSYGWSHVLDYIGVDWRAPWNVLQEQICLFEEDIRQKKRQSNQRRET